MTAHRSGHPCAWCSTAVISDGRAGWIHVDGQEACRDEQGHVLAGRYAFPRTPQWPWVNGSDFPHRDDDRLPPWWGSE